MKPTAPPPSSPPPVASVAPTAPTARKDATSEDVSIDTNGHATVLGLEIHVVDNTEKRTEDGHDFMRVQLRVRAKGEEGTVHLSSENKHGTWGGYEIDYRGGWRKNVDLTVKKTAP